MTWLLCSLNQCFTAIELSKLIPLSGFRMEQLDWRSSSSIAKSLGTIVSIAGAFIVTLYKGPALLMGLSSANSSQQPLLSQDSNWILGGLFLAADCVMASAYIIVQVKLSSSSSRLVVEISWSVISTCMVQILCDWLIYKWLHFRLLFLRNIQQSWLLYSFIVSLWPFNLLWPVWLRKETSVPGVWNLS